MITSTANYRHLAQLRQQSGLRAWLLVGSMVALLLLSSVVSAAHIHDLNDCARPPVQLADCDSDSSSDNSTDHFCPSCQLGELKLAEHHSVAPMAATDTHTINTELAQAGPRGPPQRTQSARAPPTHS